MRLRRQRVMSTGDLLLTSAVAGVCATQVLDALSTALYRRESAKERANEDAARGYMHAYEVAVARTTRALGIALDRRQIATWGWRAHKAFGLLGGLSSVALPRRYPRLGAGLGLAAGVAFFLGIDELLLPLLRLTPGPRRFSWKVHARGAASHVAYGVAAEAATRAIEGIAVHNGMRRRWT